MSLGVFNTPHEAAQHNQASLPVSKKNTILSARENTDACYLSLLDTAELTLTVHVLQFKETA